MTINQDIKINCEFNHIDIDDWIFRTGVTFGTLKIHLYLM